ncbi:MAG: DUF433 domain-containing protein [Reyranella sp.]|jgi:uncharacterized protein (DUF433 family)|nr:DUF433 domain-containing protein [Reyranella sp.]
MRAGFLKTTEAAVAAGVALRDVNHVIDEGVLPAAFVRVGAGRQVAPAACLFIAFYVESAEQLTAKERRILIRTASTRFSDWTRKPIRASAEDCIVRHKFVAVDFAPLRQAVGKRLEQLDAAKDLVESSDDILSGTPVIRGTRIPVHDVAASVEAGLPKARLLAAYPSLDANKIELAALYARANPPRGRPRAVGMPRGAVVRTDRRIARRTGAG